MHVEAYFLRRSARSLIVRPVAPKRATGAETPPADRNALVCFDSKWPCAVNGRNR